MLCNICGTKNEEDSVFCENCGTRLNEQEENSRDNAPSLDAVGYNEAPAAPLRGISLAAFVISMVAAPFGVLSCGCCIYGWVAAIVAVPFSIVSIIISIVANKKASKVGAKDVFAKVALIVSIVCLVCGLLALALIVTLYIVYGGVLGFGLMINALTGG